MTRGDDITYQPVPNVLCPDGHKRTVYQRSYWDGRRWCAYADTYFSVPAYVHAYGKTVRGYVGSEDGEPVFHAVTCCKNHVVFTGKGKAP